MYVRLAFAVAAHLEPEILMVDEVLAVGDAEFQKKCLGKMDEVSRRDGRTILFVSHNMGVISSLCKSAIWIDAGVVRRRGETRNVVGEYLIRGASRVDRVISFGNIPRGNAADDRMRLESIEWLCDLPLRHGEPVKARIHFTTRVPLEDIAVGIGFSNINGTRLLTYDTDFQNGFRPAISQSGSHSVEIAIGALPLGPDIYYLDIGCRSGDTHSLDYIPASAQIEIVAGPKTPGSIVRKDAGVRLETHSTWKSKSKVSAQHNAARIFRDFYLS